MNTAWKLQEVSPEHLLRGSLKTWSEITQGQCTLILYLRQHSTHPVFVHLCQRMSLDGNGIDGGDEGDDGDDDDGGDGGDDGDGGDGSDGDDGYSGDGDDSGDGGDGDDDGGDEGDGDDGDGFLRFL
ncbi:hypothetical protein A6R68_10055 [Neotoma lepida]|uniref:Uncharacterized protein n=1 Tax=Neotoma lepida TaxID=56216 RepID=A0A1A6FY54_NEOLE|nr:hypothetical protein A6R68_10055 [Neotoma lepida]